VNRNQYIAVCIALICIPLLYFGFDYKPSKIKSLEKSRANTLEITSIENLLMDARDKLSLEQQKILEDMRFASLEGDKPAKVESMKQYASQWYDYGYPVISAYYAEEVAKLDSTSEAWSIAGTSYMIGVKDNENDKEKSFAATKATRAFENAISLDPEDVRHKINLALVYTEVPSPSEPMKGIMMLRDLNTKYPDNPSVIIQLARLAIKTNQLDRAEERLGQALKLDPQNRQANCLMIEVLTAKGSKDIQAYVDQCNKTE
jgi:tetratricopeptide (TPR) repeat protein